MGDTAWRLVRARQGWRTTGNSHSQPGQRLRPRRRGESDLGRGGDRKRLWYSNLLKRFGGRNISWGISESPLVDSKKIVVNAGGNGASVVALDKKNGNLIWKSQSDEAGYSSAVAAQAGGVSHYILLTGEGAVGLRADNGSLLWRYERVSNRTANVATPIVRGDHVFVSSDYGTGGALLELTADRGDIEAREVYFNRSMRNHYSTSVLIGDYLYGYSSRILTCMNFKTGEVAWRDRSVGKGQIIYADGHLYLLSEDGDVGLVEATPSAYQEKSRFGIGRGDYPTWALPAIANGKLFLRDQDTLYCFNIEQSSKLSQARRSDVLPWRALSACCVGLSSPTFSNP